MTTHHAPAKKALLAAAQILLFALAAFLAAPALTAAALSTSSSRQLAVRTLQEDPWLELRTRSFESMPGGFRWELEAAPIPNSSSRLGSWWANFSDLPCRSAVTLIDNGAPAAFADCAPPSR